MKERNKVFIVVVSVILFILIAFILIDGTFLNKKYNSVWNDDYMDQLENEQSRMIAYGIRSASSHNSQPWLIKKIDQYTIELYADMEKSLPAVDHDNKQLLISQGAFIEGYIAGANHYGFVAEITYAEPDFNQKTPLIATISVHKDEQLTRVDTVTSSTYDALTLDKSTNIFETLNKVISDYPGFSYTIIDSSSDADKLESVLLEGTIIESKDEAATKELLNVFRFTEWEKSKYRNGLSLSTLPIALKPFIQPIMSFTRNDWESFGTSSIKQFKERLVLQDKYILLKYAAPTQKEYVLSGQIYQKLIFEMSSYTLKPAMQVLENFSAMESLNRKFQKEYGQSEEVVLVIGLQTKTNSTTVSNPRHLVEDIIIK